MKTHRILLLAALLTGPALADSANTAAVTTAMNTFMAPLTTAQKTAIDATSSNTNTSCLYNATLANVGIWSNLPTSGVTRNGLRYTELSTTNQTNGLAVATAALSTTGKKLLDDVRAADRYIGGETTTTATGSPNSSMWGYGKYFIAAVGTPSTTAPWTFQFGGHHLAYNITYNGTYTSGTPIFAGTEPNSWTDTTGTYSPLGAERAAIVALRNGGTYTPLYPRLDNTQTAVTATALTSSALISGTFSDVVMGPNGTGSHDTVFPKSYPTSGRGQLYSSLTAAQQVVVVDYIKIWYSYINSSISNELLAVYLSPQALAETYVAYAGTSSTLTAANNYFRIDGPRVWIEFSVQGGVYNSSSYHDHGVVRDKLADYGAAYGTTTISTTVRPPAISVQPVTQSVATGGTTTLSVTAASTGSGTATLAYQWYKDSAAISGATASTYAISSASSASAGSYYVTVISTGGLATSSSATVTVTSPPVIGTTSPLTGGTVGAAYSQTFTATGGTSPYTWTLTSGLLPSGLSLSTGGVLSGTPTASATQTFTITVTDSAGGTAAKAFTLTITEPFTAFLSTYGLTTAQAASDGDRDGVPNLLEFVLGGNPTAYNTTILPTVTYTTLGGVRAMVFTFNTVKPLGSVTWAVQTSSDLSTWTTAVAGTNGVTITTTSTSSTTNQVVVTIPATATKLFARLKASF